MAGTNGKSYPNLIAGDWKIPHGNTLENHNPADYNEIVSLFPRQLWRIRKAPSKPRVPPFHPGQKLRPRRAAPSSTKPARSSQRVSMTLPRP